ncbi:hypothetical protein JOQ06_026037, partial [Pogonophryne albipinna]
ASEKLILMAVKVSVVLCGTAGAGLAMTNSSVHLFWIISSDVMYCMMTPQVICIFYLSRWVNYLGACFGFVLAVLLRVLVGEPVIGLPDLMPLPWDKIQDDGSRYRLFPFRTAILLITLGTILLVSRLAECLFEKRKLGSEDETDATFWSYLPGLPDDLLTTLIDELGVESVEDLALMEEKDLVRYLKPIQCRKLLNGIKQGFVTINMEVRSPHPIASSSANTLASPQAFRPPHHLLSSPPSSTPST